MSDSKDDSKAPPEPTRHVNPTHTLRLIRDFEEAEPEGDYLVCVGSDGMHAWVDDNGLNLMYPDDDDIWYLPKRYARHLLNADMFSANLDGDE